MKEDVQKSIVWEDVEEKSVESWWKPEAVGDSIQGVIVDKFEISGEQKVALDTVDGVIGLPSHHILMKRLSGVDLGTLVRVTLSGIENNKSNQKYFTYRVQKGTVAGGAQ